MIVCTECGNDVAYSGWLCFDCFTASDPRRVARDEDRAEQDAEDRARSDEQDKDRRVWNEVHP